MQHTTAAWQSPLKLCAIFRCMLQDDGTAHSNSITIFIPLRKKRSPKHPCSFPQNENKNIHTLVENTELELFAFMLVSAGCITTLWEWNYLKVLWLWNPWRTARHTALLFKEKAALFNRESLYYPKATTAVQWSASSLPSTGRCLPRTAPWV